MKALLLAVLLSTSVSCAAVKKIQPVLNPGAVSIYLPPELADLVRRVAIHRDIEGITISRWATIFLVSPQQVTALLACHELQHNLQFAQYDNDFEAWYDYAALFARSTITIAIVKGRSDYLVLIPDILSGRLDPMKLAREEAVDLLRAGYANHPWEIAAAKACEGEG